MPRPVSWSLQTIITECHTLDSCAQPIYFSHFLQLKSPRGRPWQIDICQQHCLSVYRWYFRAESSCGRRVRDLCGVCFMGSDPLVSPKFPLQLPSLYRSVTQYMNVCGGAHIRIRAPCYTASDQLQSSKKHNLKTQGRCFAFLVVSNLSG